MLPFATWMDLEGYYAKWNKVRERLILYSITYVESKKKKKKGKNNHNNKNRLTDKENKLLIPVRRGEEGEQAR